MTDMEPKDRNGAGDGQRPGRKKGAPSARKRAPKEVKATEQSVPTTASELAPQSKPQPAQTQPSREPVGARTDDVGRRDDGTVDEGNFGERDAESPANVAADIKSWMDARREDGRGEVL
jgi:hypothetical protein